MECGDCGGSGVVQAPAWRQWWDQVAETFGGMGEPSSADIEVAREIWPCPQGPGDEPCQCSRPS